MHFWEFTARFRLAMGEAGSTCPKNIGLNWFIPALVKRSVGSFKGAQADEGWKVCARGDCWKNSQKVDRTRSVVHSISSEMGGVAGEESVVGSVVVLASDELMREEAMFLRMKGREDVVILLLLPCWTVP